jgi:hypothetical protein
MSLRDPEFEEALEAFKTTANLAGERVLPKNQVNFLQALFPNYGLNEIFSDFELQLSSMSAHLDPEHF